MKNRADKNEKVLCNGDIINLHQTVNGQNLFVVLNVLDLDIKYAHDLTRPYEYDKEDLLAVSSILGYPEWEIIGNIYNLIPNVSF